MKSSNSIILLFLIIGSLFFVSCGETPDCSIHDTTYGKYIYDEESKTCKLDKSIKKNFCGNGIIEEGEDFCSCPKDVSKTHKTLGCLGEEGNFLEKQCENLKCVLKQNNKVTLEKKSLDLKNSDLTFKVEIDIFKPFVINSVEDNSININVELFNLNTQRINIKDILVKSIEIKNLKEILLGEIDINTKFEKIESKATNLKIKINDLPNYTNNEYLKLELTVTYTKEYLNSKGEVEKTDNKKEILKYSLGNYIIINPIKSK